MAGARRRPPAEAGPEPAPVPAEPGGPGAAPEADPAVQALLAISRDAVLVVRHADRRILAASGAAERTYGTAIPALCRLRYDDLVTDRNAVEDIFAQHRNHVPLRYHRRADGSRFPVEMAIHWLPGPQGQEHGWLRITDLTRAEEDERRRRAAEDSYRAIFRSAPFPALLLDRRGLVTDANEAALALYRHSRVSLIGQAMAQLLHDPRAARRYFSQSRWQAQAERHRRGDGSEFVADVFVSNVSLSGEVHAIVVVRDVTDEQALLARLQASEARWRFALEGHGDALWEWDLARNSFHVSRELSEQVAADVPEEHGPGYWSGLVHPDDRGRLRRALVSHFKAEAPLIDVEIRLLSRSGSHRWVWLRGRALERSSAGRVLRVLGSVRDVHDQKQQADELAQWREQVQHAARLTTMGEMAGALAHELNQPLTSIRNFSAAALHRLDKQALHDPAEVRRAVQLIADESMRAGRIIRQLRSFMRKGPLRTEAVPPNELVISVQRLAEIRAQRLGAQIELELGTELPPLRADRVLAEQLLLNLVNNSLEAMRSQDGPRRVVIATAPGPAGMVTLSVHDTGPGLPASLVQHLYTPFVTTKAEGLGLGLAICQTIVDSHHGRIRADNHPAGGALIQVSLPIHEELPHEPAPRPRLHR